MARDDDTPHRTGPADRDLVRRARRGDASAFDRLVGRHGRLVLSLARSVTRHRQDAEDVAQEVFLRFYRHLDRFDAARPVEPWLVRLTLNAARSHVRRAPAGREDGLESGAPARESEGNPESDLLAADLRAALRRGAEALTDRERDVFLLRDVHGLTVELIAEALGVSPITVRRQSADARRKLTEWIRRHHPEMLR
jgi:RNA polymerase sigma-70 factor (ECF subfamily)